MAEAKRRKENLRTQILSEIEQDLRPLSETDLVLLRHIETLSFRTVQRRPLQELRTTGMKTGQCHVNAREYARLDPDGRARAVHGWWRQGPVFVLHSIAERDGQFACLTPLPAGHCDYLEFSEDKEISIQSCDGKEALLWRDIRPPNRIPADQAQLGIIYAPMRKRLLRGDDPMKVANDPQYW